jgi:hypothetical protein
MYSPLPLPATALHHASLVPFQSMLLTTFLRLAAIAKDEGGHKKDEKECGAEERH